MKLNASILFNALKTDLPVEMYGRGGDGLHLERPKFYTEGEKTFCANQLYLAMADRLPHRPELQEGAVILCVGDSLQLSHYRERCCLLQIRDKADFFGIANAVQDVYDRYDEWSEKLQEILDGTASVKDMLEYSCGVFENPLFVIDADFHITASAGYAELVRQKGPAPAGADNLSLPTMAQFLEQREPSMQETEPMLINMLDTSSLNTNLFRGGEYIGCLTVDYRLRRHLPSDIPLVKYLAGMVVAALQKLSAASGNERGILKSALQDTVEGLPTTSEQHRALENANAGKTFACIKMKLGSRFAKLPIGYICNQMESTVPKSIAFEHGGAVVGFIELEGTRDLCDAHQEALDEMFSRLDSTMDLYMGVSDVFDDLFSARLFYKQAAAALETGSLLRAGERYFRFQDFALAEMVANAIGELPLELYYSNGLRRLVKHDAESSTSYLDTLRVYLDNNMSVSKTAAALFVHRSTLLERISRIERDLETDLRDADERLRLQLLLKAMRVHEQMRGAAGNGGAK